MRCVPPTADKNALRTQLKVNMLRIRERELLFFTNNCLSISTSAVTCPHTDWSHHPPALDALTPDHQALLAGFAWYGLTEVPFDLQANVVRNPVHCGIAGSRLAVTRAAHRHPVPTRR